MADPVRPDGAATGSACRGSGLLTISRVDGLMCAARVTVQPPFEPQRRAPIFPAGYDARVEPTVAVYVYNGWHPCAERDAHFGKGWTEWELVRKAMPHFEGHQPPSMPVGGAYDDRDPEVWARRFGEARDAGVDVLIHGWFWSRGKKVFEEALDRGHLVAAGDGRTGGGPGSRSGAAVKFAVMWANRMPHRVLPLRLVDPTAPPGYRKVYTDPDDFVAMVSDCAERYFHRADYWRLGGKPYLSIFDASLFVRQLGATRAAEAISRAKDRVGGLHVAAIDPEPALRAHVADIGFDSVTHYVALPAWKGAGRQDFQECARLRAASWDGWQGACGVPYFPSVSPGWDATPRGTLYPRVTPNRHPWAPLVTGTSPAAFGAFAQAAAAWTTHQHGDHAPLFVASWNEFSEGHAIEPDERHGRAWLDALRTLKRPR